jgi:hypothetical protein
LHHPQHTLPDLNEADLITVRVESKVFQRQNCTDPEARTDPINAESLPSKILRRLEVRPRDNVCGTAACGAERDNKLEVLPLPSATPPIATGTPITPNVSPLI